MENAIEVHGTILAQYGQHFLSYHITDIFKGWFQGLSNAFLSSRTARLLVLAGTDRLDKELMIGQMQGKFQMEVVPAVGHMLHEVRDLS